MIIRLDWDNEKCFDWLFILTKNTKSIMACQLKIFFYHCPSLAWQPSANQRAHRLWEQVHSGQTQKAMSFSVFQSLEI